MELARFELARPSAELARVRSGRMFHTADKTYGDVYVRILDRVFRRYIYDDFVQLVDLLGDLEGLIIQRVEVLAREGRPINVSLPDFFLLPDVDKAIIYDPNTLHKTINLIIDYVNALGIDALLPDPHRVKIAPLEQFAGKAPDMQTKLQLAPTDTSNDTLIWMKKRLTQELEVAEYVREIEGYHCAAISRVQEIRAVCSGLVDKMS
jgi:hypothetical protein